MLRRTFRQNVDCLRLSCLELRVRTGWTDRQTDSTVSFNSRWTGGQTDGKANWIAERLLHNERQKVTLHKAIKVVQLLPYTLSLYTSY